MVQIGANFQLIEIIGVNHFILLIELWPVFCAADPP